MRVVIDTEMITIEIQDQDVIDTIVMKRKTPKVIGVTEIKTIIIKRVNADEEVEVDHIVRGEKGEKGKRDAKEDTVTLSSGMTEIESIQSTRLGIRLRRRDCRRRLSMRKSRRSGSGKERKNQLN